MSTKTHPTRKAQIIACRIEDTGEDNSGRAWTRSTVILGAPGSVQQIDAGSEVPTIKATTFQHVEAGQTIIATISSESGIGKSGRPWKSYTLTEAFPTA